MSRRIELWGGAFSAEVPPGWSVVELDEVIELEPPDHDAAAHFSVYQRSSPAAPKEGEAAGMLAGFVEGKASCSPLEFLADDRDVALATFRDNRGDATEHWLVGARISPSRMLVFSFNAADAGRGDAIALFESVQVSTGA